MSTIPVPSAMTLVGGGPGDPDLLRVGALKALCAADDSRGTIDWDLVARSGLTIVLPMGVQNLPAITAQVVAAGRPATDPVAVISTGSHADENQLTFNLEEPI